jgi:hypothetical protein
MAPYSRFAVNGEVFYGREHNRSLSHRRLHAGSPETGETMKRRPRRCGLSFTLSYAAGRPRRSDAGNPTLADRRSGDRTSQGVPNGKVRPNAPPESCGVHRCVFSSGATCQRAARTTLTEAPPRQPRSRIGCVDAPMHRDRSRAIASPWAERGSFSGGIGATRWEIPHFDDCARFTRHIG